MKTTANAIPVSFDTRLKSVIYDISDKILSKLLLFREANEGFTFSVRERDSAQSDEIRLAQGQWFQGSNYIYVPLFGRGDTARKIKTLGFVLTFEDDGEISENYLEISFKGGMNDEDEIRFHQELAKELSINLNHQRFGTWHYDEPEDYLKNLDDYLTRVYPKALGLLKKYDLSEKYLIDEKTFSKRITRINEIKQSHKNEIGPAVLVNPILNRILYGPPGTGKTHRLNEIKIKDFTDSLVKKTNEELLHDALVEYPFWKVLGAVLHTSVKGLSVTELVEHPMVRYRIKPGLKTKPQNLAWADLQSYADDESTQLSSKYRRSIKLFHKDRDGKWSIAEDKKASVSEIIDVELINLMLSRTVKTAEPTTEVKRYNFITFHQKYSYEDFIEGIKPVLQKRTDDALELDVENPGHLAFELKQGIFFDSCLKALELAGYNSFEECYRDTAASRKQKFGQSKPFALFIDEINRANVSAVFGELITLVEENKRIGSDEEMWIQLPQSQTYFAVPPNLHIIGTMNTADKSIALIDIALRRRFEFEGYYPKYDHINSEAANILKAVNKFVYEKKGSADYLIGHAYFMNDRPIENTLRTKVIPLLMEYFMGKTSSVEEAFRHSGKSVVYNAEAYNWIIS